MVGEKWGLEREKWKQEEEMEEGEERKHKGEKWLLVWMEEEEKVMNRVCLLRHFHCH